MEIYLIDRETGENKQTFTNVKHWEENYVVYENGGYLGKIYCDTEIEYFTDICPQEVLDE